MTSKPDHQRVREVFAALLDVPADQRAAALAEACGDDAPLRAEVEDLLTHHDNPNDALADDRAGLGAAIVGQRAEEDQKSRSAPGLQPVRVGAYEVVRQIGEGGMGAIYEARQESPQRRVVIKMLRPSALSLPEVKRRFRYEAEILGHLQHPGIAHIYEAGFAEVTFAGGTTVEEPFFAMEYIDGLPLLEYANDRKLDLRARLELMQRICAAVHHAHLKGVVHRDLKPANILVDALEQPKVLDFGIARITGSDLQATTMQTEAGQIIGTVAYMSPEQVSGDAHGVDVRSDVYALGVLLYELLAGKPPYDLSTCSLPDAARMIREVEPTRLRHVSTTLRGDIETIVARALEKDRERRYESAAQLGEDLRRFLSDEPIIARPASAAYQLSKFAKRNKAIVIGTAAVFVALVVGLIGTTCFALGEAEQRRRAVAAEIAARDEAKRAQEEAKTAQQVSDFVTELFQVSDPSEARGNSVTAREILDRGVDRIGDELADEPAVQARLMAVMGDVYQGLGLHRESLELLEQALVPQRRLHGEDHVDTLATKRLVAQQRLELGQMESAETMHREVLAARRAMHGDQHYDVAESAADLGVLLLRLGKTDEAESLFRESLAIFEGMPGDDREREGAMAAQWHHLGSIASARGDYAQAEQLYREAVESQTRARGPDHPYVQIGLNALGLALRDLSKFDEAEVTLRKALALGEKLHGADNAHIAPTINNLALTLQNRGKLAEAEPLYRKLLEIDRRDLGDEHMYVAGDLNNLATLLQDMGEHAKAEQMHREALAIRRKLLGDDHPDTLISASNLGLVCQQQGKLDEAEQLFSDTLARQLEKLGPHHRDTLVTQTDLALVYRNQERYEKSKSLLTDTLDAARIHLGEDYPLTLSLLNNWAGWHEAQGMHAEAEPIFAEVLRRRRAKLGPTHRHTISSVVNIAENLELLDRIDEAMQTLRDAIADFPVGAGDPGAAPLVEMLDRLEASDGAEVP